MKQKLSIASLTLVLAGGLLLATAPQAQAACNPFANRPTYGGNLLTGTGGSTGCSSSQWGDVLLRDDQTFTPDDTIAQSGPVHGSFSRQVSKFNPGNGQYYIETRLSTGAKAKSANRSVG